MASWHGSQEMTASARVEKEEYTHNARPASVVYARSGKFGVHDSGATKGQD